MKNKTSFILIVGLVLIIIIIGLAVFRNKKSENMSNQNQPVNLPSGLIIEDQIIGSGLEAISGKMVVVNYTGTLENGQKFDSSYDHGQPFSFTLGVGQVIRGWDEGVAGMKVGGKRKLTIPPELGYGNQDMGNGLIPPNSTLIFEVELLDVK